MCGGDAAEEVEVAEVRLMVRQAEAVNQKKSRVKKVVDLVE